MKKYNIILLTLILLFTAGCVKNQFQIEFSLPSDTRSTYTLVYYASAKNGGRIMEMVAAPAMGKCEVECLTRYPTLVYIYAGNMNRPAAYIYAERGDKIEIKGKSDNPAEWTVSGNDINKEWSKWRNGNSRLLMSNDPEKINAAVAKFVKEHKDSRVAALLLLTYFDRSIAEDTYCKLWGSLGEKAERETMASIVARSDQFLSDVSERGRLKAIPYMMRGDSIDTLRFKGARASIVYFWHSDDSERRAVIDTLKKLTKDYPDSTRRVIADFSFNPDSTDWLLTMRYDSLKTVRRGWIFRGEADESMRNLGVIGTPWIIVTDAKGNQKYFGTDIKKGSEVFRREMKGKK